MAYGFRPDIQNYPYDEYRYSRQDPYTGSSHKHKHHRRHHKSKTDKEGMYNAYYYGQNPSQNLGQYQDPMQQYPYTQSLPYAEEPYQPGMQQYPYMGNSPYGDGLYQGPMPQYRYGQGPPYGAEPYPGYMQQYPYGQIPGEGPTSASSLLSKVGPFMDIVRIIAPSLLGIGKFF
jgi:hypothetical protein